MLQRRTVMLSGALVVALCLLPAPSNAKQRHRSGVSQCQRSVAARISRDHPRSRGSSFASNVQRSPRGNNAVRISGRGNVRTAKGRKRGFTYSCVFNTRSGVLSKVSYKIR